jgi:hypothetical protein
MPDAVSDIYISTARHSLSEGLKKIEHCLAQLTDDQIWHRPRQGIDGEMNSIANLLLHLSGNLRQWVITGITQGKDIRNRPAEFADRSHRSATELLNLLRQTITEADVVLSRLTADELTAPRHIQGHETNVLAAAFDSISHFRGHVQEIIHLTRAQLGGRYKYYFVPKGKEQESASGPPL